MGSRKLLSVAVAAVAALLVVVSAAADPPVNLTLPVISGGSSPNPKVGETLTVTPATWDVAPESVERSWLRCDTNGAGCSAIAGQSGLTYALADADKGATIRVREIAKTTSPPEESAPADSAATAVVHKAPALSSAPALNTTTPSLAAPGLTVGTGTWDAFPTELTYEYTWQSCTGPGAGCTTVGGNANAYTLVDGDTGKWIRVTVKATNAAGNASHTVSAADAVRRWPVRVDGTPPTLSTAAAQRNVSLSVSVPAGAFTGYPASFTYTYQWQRCTSTNPASCTDLDGATGDAYSPVTADLMRYLRARVTADNTVGPVPSGANVHHTALTQQVQGSPINAKADGTVDDTVPPKINEATADGRILRGETLTAANGLWSAFPAVSGYAYQWQRCASADPASCANVDGATNQTYVPAGADIGQRLRLRVTASNGVAPPPSPAPQNVAFSAVTTNPVLAAPVNNGEDGTVLPTPPTDAAPGGNADGTPTLGEKLTGTSGVWFAFPGPSPPAGLTALKLEHQWWRCDADGFSCVRVNPDPNNGAARVVTTVGPVPVDPAPYKHTSKSEYPLTEADLGHTFKLDVYASNGLPNASSEVKAEITEPSAAVRGKAAYRGALADQPAAAKVSLTDDGTPDGTPDGKPARGETLTLGSGWWTGFQGVGAAPLVLKHRWQRCPADGPVDQCVPVDPAVEELTTPLGLVGEDGPAVTCTSVVPCTSASTYLLSNADLGYRIRGIVTGVNAVGDPVTVTSALSDAVVGAPILVTQPGSTQPTQPPVITGAATVDFTLALTSGQWSAFPAEDKLTFSYEWLRCTDTTVGSCTAIPGATAATYKVVEADKGLRLRGRVTAKNGVLPNGVAVSANTGIVLARGGSGGGGGAEADLIVQLGIVTSGAEATLKATVFNVGGAEARNVSLSGKFGAGLAVTGVTTTRGSCTTAVACSLGTIGKGESAVVTVNVRASASGAFTYEFVVSSSPADGFLGNNDSDGEIFLQTTGFTPRKVVDPDAKTTSTKKTDSNVKVARVVRLSAKRTAKTATVAARFTFRQKGSVSVAVVREDDKKKVKTLYTMLAGSSFADEFALGKAKKLQTTIRKPGTYALKLVFDPRSIVKTKIYLIRFTLKTTVVDAKTKKKKVVTTVVTEPFRG